ncbi:ATP-binding cassette domain-containing protein [Sphingomonas sp. DG1-23]|uniref:ATP-binding cassette domain-containing protein n=1 Tax=Sphingomonas sp. DG1-23 TaxID=3068316 RepID=UPI00273DDA40|nr:ATP-binding cassette domain-containing protein [Sphingomonas sp. DG1-23]MDP5279273.1 ATP-binding cassette domain-containing protein [Sphingomonas sp. DG1-23]
MTVLIDLATVSVERAGRGVVCDVDLRIPKASWTGIIGANGSGKTSLLRALAGRLPFAGGSCRILGDECAGDRAGRASRIGFAPPADKLPDALRGRDLLAFLGTGLERPGARLLREALGLDMLLGRWIGDCSAGMRQRIAVAAAFAEGKDIVVLDEPFNWLDPVAAFDLREALRAMVDEGLTLITALHDLSTLAIACDAGLMLADGRAVLKLDKAVLRSAAADLAGFERRTIHALRSGAVGHPPPE